MKIIKSRRLCRGDVIGIFAPASPPATIEKLNKGIKYLENLGFRVELGKHIYKKRGYLAGSDEQRASDVNSLFGNPKVKAIFTVRGGYGSHRIIPLLDYQLIKNNPKIFVGYSDITALHFALLAKTGLITFSGPMVAVEMSEGLSGKREELFWEMLMSPNNPKPLCGKSIKGFTYEKNKITTGHLLGGNLSIIDALVGTPYFPSINNPIFLLEEIDERPYRIDRMLQQMKLAGIFKKSGGVALGDFSSCKAEKGKPTLTIDQIIRETFSDNRIPVIAGIHFGHLHNSIHFPIGVKVKFNTQKNRLTFTDGGVH